jgi:molybdenum cofactor cytidylyltransferase
VIKKIQISAIIPVAGLSSRMHQYKPVLKLGNLTLIEHTIGVLKQCNISDIIVVTGHNSEKIQPIIQKTDAIPVFNTDFKAGMFSSIKRGIKKISSQTQGFLLLPGDIPLIRPASIQAMIEAAKKNPKNIIIPYFKKVPGHPPYIPAWLIPDILKLKNDSNLGTLLLSLKKHQRRQVVHDQGILLDADTKKAYCVLKKKYISIDVPDKKECDSILHANLKAEKKIQAHVKLVAETAMAIAKSIQARALQTKTMQMTSGQNKPDHIDLDMNLIYAGALLHDIKRKQNNHAKEGAKYLLNLGFPKLADIVSQHMDLSLPLSDYLTEAHIVYFADKLCTGASLEPDLNYYKRFQNKIERTPHAKNIILKRYEHTRIIQTRIENIIKKPLKSILS